MKCCTFLTTAALVGAGAFFTAQVISQDTITQSSRDHQHDHDHGHDHGHDHNGHDHDHAQGEQGMDQEMMAKWQKHATPGKAHKRLDPMVGTWDQTITWWQSPDAEPQTSESTATYEWIMGGRFIKGTYEGRVMGQQFEGMDITGYDNFTEEYFTMWIDNMNTSMMVTRGEYDTAKDALIMTGTHNDVMTGEKDKEFRAVTRFPGPDTSVYTMYTTGPDGEEFKAMEIRSERTGKGKMNR